MSIYVEILIRAPMEAVWRRTQRPELHARWDLRFSRIEYLPRQSKSEPQRFLYSTRIGLGVPITGEGETVGTLDAVDGSRSSALKFSSDDRRSVIQEGSGYWKYVPTPKGTRFLTSYDYRTRFGHAGRLFDRLFFRPLLGWATAWSFDRLRLWLEDGIDPSLALRGTLVHGLARLGLAVVFAYQGLVPKLLGPQADEVIILRDVGVPAGSIGAAVAALGVAEVLFALTLVVLWRNSWPPRLVLVAMLLATIGVAAGSPRYLGAAFNPLSLNLAVACLAGIDLLVLKGVPSAGRCRRRPVPGPA
jgi:hypothetical protein